ncbi:MAG: ABC transporter substrate-binding protein [Ilumatobacteraceae bacterium]
MIPTGNRTKKATENLGLSVGVYEEIPQGVDNWRPYVEKLKEQNVQVLIQYIQATPLVAAMKAMNDVGYFPKYIIGEGNFYDATLIKEGGDLLTKTTWLINLMMWPFEDAANNPATQQFLDILKQYGNGAEAKSLSVNSFSAWLLFAKAAAACGSELTRACVMFNASQTKEWSGGGLHVTVQPGPTTSKNSDCYSVLTATPQGFVLAKDWVDANDKIYNCDPKNSEQVAGLDS